jgi:lysyl-tRNA synthetase, class II
VSDERETDDEQLDFDRSAAQAAAPATAVFDAGLLAKRQALLDAGAAIYPYTYASTSSVDGARDLFVQAEEGGDNTAGPVRLAGRIWARRGMGGTIFMDLRDHSGKIQLYLNRSGLEEGAWRHLAHLDLGDLLGVEGELCRTRSGEVTLRVSAYCVLAKIVLPLPVGKEAQGRSFGRLRRPESRYRDRHLTWMLDEEARHRIVLRSRLIAAVRLHFEEEDFLEVETPTLSSLYGGAEARPFRTRAWALGDKSLYMRISPELHLKRYLVAGFERVFTVCSNFRNEGMDRSHNPEFTMLEWYEAYTDYHRQLQRFEALVAAVCRHLHGTTCIEYQGTQLDFTPPWPRLTVLAALKQYADIDADGLTAAQLVEVARRRGIEADGEMSWGRAVALLFEETCEAHLVQPTFVLDHPLEICPLTRRHRRDPRLAERFEPYVCGMELGNAYSELNDPVEQVERLEEQRRHRRDPEYQDHPLDGDFVHAMGCGMPPAGGVGLGIDRLAMLLSDAPNIREVIPFPLLRPRSGAAAEQAEEE